MQETLSQQQFFMQWALKLGEKGRITAPPNPWVGCVIVREKEIVGEGYHVRPGDPHAESVALEQAKNLAKGATAYVTLEPCSHHGRTPPCVEALIRAGIKKVVIPFLDPDPKVSGNGVGQLKQAGIEVTVGICKEEAEVSLEPYLIHRRTKKPFCLLKAAASLDGRTAAVDGTSQWITGEEARKDVHRLRAESQAILVGWKTVLQDHPQLNVRGKEAGKREHPLRVVVDARGTLPADLFDLKTGGKVIVFTTSQCSSQRIQDWQKKGYEVHVSPEKEERVPLEPLLEELGARGVVQLLVEGGSGIHSSFLQKQLAHQLTLYIGGCLLGAEGKPLFSGIKIPSISQAPRLHLKQMFRFGEDMRLDYRLIQS